MPATAEVVIIGGGVMGTSIAFHLAEAGIRDVLLLERDALGSGSTSKAAGGVRGQFSDAVNIQLGARSLELFRDFGNRPGQEIDLHLEGYLFLLSREEDVAAFERNVAVQNELGVPSRMVSAAEAGRLSPLISTAGVLAAAYSPDDGYCSPESVVLGYATAARRLGARLVTGCRVTGMERAVGASDVTTVLTDRGQVTAQTVICAAGAWSAAVGAMAGVDLPVQPYRRQILVTGPVPDAPSRIPMTIDFSTSFYFHGEGNGVLLGMSDPDEPVGFDLARTDAWLPRLSEAMSVRAPRLLEAGIATGWAGLYEVTPDHNALIGEAPGPGRFLYATGFSGHGFLQGPAVGEVVRDLYLGRRPFVDISALSSERFLHGAPRKELNCV
ncbi:NAD(P)/FAD-dependent oxidoreductase [Streptomyces longispororuber]|uniref:NAD(P)/FAD-dependent oxidoreductase n=1 Tax=Streptomyces longispororuber TaxID=68230 RepID=UPI0036F4C4CE